MERILEKSMLVILINNALETNCCSRNNRELSRVPVSEPLYHLAGMRQEASIPNNDLCQTPPPNTKPSICPSPPITTSEAVVGTKQTSKHKNKSIQFSNDINMSLHNINNISV